MSVIQQSRSLVAKVSVKALSSSTVLMGQALLKVTGTHQYELSLAAQAPRRLTVYWVAGVRPVRVKGRVVMSWRVPLQSSSHSCWSAPGIQSRMALLGEMP